MLYEVITAAGSGDVATAGALGGSVHTNGNTTIFQLNDSPAAVITSYSIHYTKLYDALDTIFTLHADHEQRNNFV